MDFIFLSREPLWRKEVFLEMIFSIRFVPLQIEINGLVFIVRQKKDHKWMKTRVGGGGEGGGVQFYFAFLYQRLLSTSISIASV